jgi:hypothetical protein
VSFSSVKRLINSYVMLIQVVLYCFHSLQINLELLKIQHNMCSEKLEFFCSFSYGDFSNLSSLCSK